MLENDEIDQNVQIEDSIRHSEIKDEYNSEDKKEDGGVAQEGGMGEESEEERAQRRRINDEKKQRQLDEKFMKHLH